MPQAFLHSRRDGRCSAYQPGPPVLHPDRLEGGTPKRGERERKDQVVARSGGDIEVGRANRTMWRRSDHRALQDQKYEAPGKSNNRTIEGNRTICRRNGKRRRRDREWGLCKLGGCKQGQGYHWFVNIFPFVMEYLIFDVQWSGAHSVMIATAA